MIQRIAKFFRLGQLPEVLQGQLLAEGGPRYLEEGTPFTAVLRDFRARGFFCGHRRMSFIGYLALSDRRLVASARFHHEVSVNVAFDQPEFQSVRFRLAGKRLIMAFEAQGLIPHASGEVQLRVRVSEPDRVAELLRAGGAVFVGKPRSGSKRQTPAIP